MYCLDSNIVIEIFRGNPNLKNKIENLQKENKEFFINPIILCELYKGVYSSNKKDIASKFLEEFLKEVIFLEFDKESCREFGELYDRLSKKGKMTQEKDLMIASICIKNNLILITQNKKHFENIPRLKAEFW